MTPSVLLVDDDPIGSELTLAALQELNLGITVHLAADGEEALNVLFRRLDPSRLPPTPPYLVLLDLKMPKISGHEVLQQIRASDELRDLRVVILTSSDQLADRKLSEELGSNAYVQKPHSIFDLIDAFRRIHHLFDPDLTRTPR